MQVVRRILLEHLDKVEIFMSRDLPPEMALKAYSAYLVISKEAKVMELHNLSQLAKFGTLDQARQVYEVKTSDAAYPQFKKEREEFLSEKIVLEFEPIRMAALAAHGIRVKPVEIGALMSLGVVVPDAGR